MKLSIRTKLLHHPQDNAVRREDVGIKSLNTALLAAATSLKLSK